MTPTEQAIITLRDQGLSERQIVKSGYAPQKVLFTLSAYGSDTADQASRAHQRKLMVRGSRRLAFAVIDLLEEISKRGAA